jgi:hypothetical protein
LAIASTAKLATSSYPPLGGAALPLATAASSASSVSAAASPFLISAISRSGSSTGIAL